MRFLNICTILVTLSVVSSSYAWQSSYPGGMNRMAQDERPINQNSPGSFKQAKPLTQQRWSNQVGAPRRQGDAANSAYWVKPAQPMQHNLMNPPYANSSSLLLKVFHPLVRDKGNGNFEVNPNIDSVLPDIKNMTKGSYLLRKNDPTWPKLLAAFKDDGWEVIPFIGRAGRYRDVGDTPGMVAYSAKNNTLIITFRGSDGTGKTGRFLNADWEVNLEGGMINTPLGKMHRGFYHKVLSSMPNIVQIIRKIFRGLDAQQKSTLQIFFTGHSQGAALATIAAEMIAEDLKSPDLLGENFDNLKTNTIQLIIFSAPRVVGDENALQIFNHTIGKQNAIRQNVVGRLANDPVPVGSPGKTMTSVYKSIPIVGQKLANKYGGGAQADSGVRSVGYLAADKARDVYARNARREANAYVRANIKDLKSVRSPQDLRRAVKGIAYRSATVLLAPLHYGGIDHASSVEKGSAFTSLALLETAPPLKQLLWQGYEHQLRANSGIRGKIRRGIEAIGNKKVSLENKVVGVFRRSKPAPVNPPANEAYPLPQNRYS